ncbi:hypothetical protein [Actinoplanes sp. NBRC 103695]|uniref:hypothetical protein n=1 Tax=Actinoplanes sp. NBRC 103695 TaxID=3032202 RepID=UPI0024A3029F|nr:hypothetical protein [Actinoplanes sp. NBRC 103695]GLZ02266.1 hypothetical protein Acsp02_95170 [Actinoplanes sp. NBRC 103695]
MVCASSLEHRLGAQLAGAPTRERPGALPRGTVVEIAGTRLRLGADLHRRKVTLRLDGHLMHVIHDGRLVKNLPAPIPADQRTTLRGARLTTTQLPAPLSGPISVQRKAPADGKIMVARQILRIGRTYPGDIVTVHVEDTHFRVTRDGAELGVPSRIAYASRAARAVAVSRSSACVASKVTAMRT